MKKNVLLVLVALLAIVVAGCGGDTSSNKEKKAEVSKSKIAEMSIENGEYVIPFSEDGEGGSDTYIAFDVKVKNTGKEQMYVTPDSFSLFEKGEMEKYLLIQVIEQGSKILKVENFLPEKV